MMDDRNTQIFTEDETGASRVQQSPMLSSTRHRADASPTVSEASQEEFPDVTKMGQEKWPSSGLGGPQREPKHQEAPSEIGTQEKNPPARSGPPETPEEQQQLGTEPEGHPGSPQKAKQDQPQEDSQDPEDQSPAHQAANSLDAEQVAQLHCPPNSCGEPPGDDYHPQEAGFRPQEALPEPSAEGVEASPQKTMPLMPGVTEGDMIGRPLLGPETPHSGGPSMETQSAPQSSPLEASDTGKRRELNYTPESTEAAGPQSPENPQPSFIKCLLEAEEADPQQKAPKAKAQTWKVRAPRVRKSPKTPMPVQSSIPVNSSALSLSLTLSQTISAHVGTPLWAPLPVPAPKSSLAPASVPRSALHAPTRDLGWRRSVLLCQSKKWSLSYTMSRQESHKGCLFSPYPDWDEPPHEHLTLKQEEAFRTYFKIFNGPGEVDAHSLQNTVRIMGFSLTPAQVRDALMSADVDGNGHVDFKDFLAVMTDTKRFFCSMKQNTLLLATASPNPYTLFFEILSLLVEMLALPEMALEEITNYYKKKLNNGTRRAQEMAPAMGQQWSQKQLPYNCQQAYHLNIPEQRVHRIPSRLRHRNYACDKSCTVSSPAAVSWSTDCSHQPGLRRDRQSPSSHLEGPTSQAQATSLSANMHNSYAQVPCIPMCPRTDRMVACRKPVSYMLHPWTRTSWSPTHSLLYQPGLQGSREHNSNNRKRFSSTPSRTY